SGGFLIGVLERAGAWWVYVDPMVLMYLLDEIASRR
ncbi:HAD family hydrolase, partial [Pseudomonas syringae pv. tagetis]